jgi:hypothetical protein
MQAYDTVALYLSLLLAFTTANAFSYAFLGAAARGELRSG